jgi:hypothetical protein
VVLWRGEALNPPYDEGVTILPGRGRFRTSAQPYPGRVTDELDDDADDAPERDDDPVDGVDIVDTNVDRFIDRMVQGTGGTLAGNAMIGMAKGMGLHKEPEIAGEIREISPPDPDQDDPIEVTIDPDHPEKTRIVYRMRASDASED